MHAQSVQLCPTLSDLWTGSSVHGILQARILEWVAMPSSRGIFLTQGLKPHLMSPALVGRFFITSATWEAQSCVVKLIYLKVIYMKSLNLCGFYIVSCHCFHFLININEAIKKQ